MGLDMVTKVERMKKKIIVKSDIKEMPVFMVSRM